MSAERDPAEVLAALRASVRSVQLATIDADGDPHAGYTPFAFDGAAFVVLVSQLSVHTRDLLATGRCGAMLIEDEADAAKIFARTRAMYRCRAEVVERDGPERERLLEVLHERHGKMIGLLRQLPDFVLFRLVPDSGQFVMGFGQAFRLSGEALDRFEHVTTG